MQSPEAQKVVSILEVYNIGTRQRTVVREFPYLIEAPDWTPDGKHLIYNSEGLLYKLPLDSPGEEELIDTGLANQCNNDHLVSPDGKWLAISHRSLPKGRPTIFVLPSVGGNPVQVTPSEPSYMHGWSPDSKYITYCGARNDELDVYTCRTDGKEEIRLTTAEGLNDGPEFSPDGQYIWFNSERTGLMQIWRMKTDGTEQTQMTFDENRNSWFPHLSPNGKHLVYLAFSKDDVRPYEHLRYKNVELRMMLVAGGEPYTIVNLFGGQGTINVNSWSPDSSQFAFVSYRLE